MPTKKCRYCGAIKGNMHHARCQTRTDPLTPSYDPAVYVTAYDTSTISTGGGSSCDTGSTSTTDAGSCG